MMIRAALGFSLTGSLLAMTACTAEPRRLEFREMHMGTRFRIVLHHADRERAWEAAAAAFARIAELEGSLSDYRAESELNRLGRRSGSGTAVPVSEDLWRVLVRAQELAERSDGAFDVTVGPLVQLWRRARRQGQLPRSFRLADALARVGHDKLRLDPARRTAELTAPGMRLDLGGIAKGFAVAEALAELRAQGIDSALVDGGGDIAVGTAPPSAAGWRIAIDPRLEEPSDVDEVLELADRAVATSGDASRFIEIEGVRYSHILDPRTGLGMTSRGSVTVIADDAMLADGLASALSVLEPEDGLALLALYPGAEAAIRRLEGNQVREYASPGWTPLTPSEPAAP